MNFPNGEQKDRGLLLLPQLAMMHGGNEHIECNLNEHSEWAPNKKTEKQSNYILIIYFTDKKTDTEQVSETGRERVRQTESGLTKRQTERKRGDGQTDRERGRTDRKRGRQDGQTDRKKESKRAGQTDRQESRPASQRQESRSARQTASRQPKSGSDRQRVGRPHRQTDRKQTDRQRAG